MPRSTGLGLLDVRTDFTPDKTLRLPSGTALGVPAAGYEIHHGRVTVGGGAEEFLGGARAGNVFGTMWHGSLEGDELRGAFLAAALGRRPQGSASPPPASAASTCSATSSSSTWTSRRCSASPGRARQPGCPFFHREPEHEASGTGDVAVIDATRSLHASDSDDVHFPVGCHSPDISGITRNNRDHRGRGRLNHGSDMRVSDGNASILPDIRRDVRTRAVKHDVADQQPVGGVPEQQAGRWAAASRRRGPGRRRDVPPRLAWAGTLSLSGSVGGILSRGRRPRVPIGPRAPSRPRAPRRPGRSRRKRRPGRHRLAAWALTPDGNPAGPPVTIPLALAGLPASQRDGRLRAAVTGLIGIAGAGGARAIVIENLDFSGARQQGRERAGSQDSRSSPSTPPTHPDGAPSTGSPP